MPRLIWSIPASLDLDRIDAWLTEHRPPRHTLATIRAIRERAEWLSTFPRGGRPGLDGLRVVHVSDSRYVIVYRLVGDDVIVVRVHHERQDW
ncbi:type II toxin-antitoxin system RelE/ParE family toxin [Sphingomonas floccifaciens]|uniref:Type II toxin-antitoxin system RelE/ParE family toxin n=1 Tax=Sphingomonas floccifaciens TaxID=1844115 RepID=A0ABW4NAX5_9SPHN